MPSEYQKWVARDVKPVEKRELTPAEKRKNWLYYHRWQLFWTAIVAVCIFSFISSVVSGKKEAPDIQIAYIATTSLTDEVLKKLESELTGFGEDITGDGKVKVRINQYIMGEDVMTLPKLTADLTSGDSRIYILEDPESFQDTYGPLGYTDGVFGDGTNRDEPLWYLWADCPALTALDIPNREQARMGRLYIARRGVDADYEYGNVENAIWAKILSGFNFEEKNNSMN